MKNSPAETPSIGWSKFARHRHQEGMGFSYFTGSDEELLDLIRENWDKRTKGNGSRPIDNVCLVPVDPSKFITSNVAVDDVQELSARLTRRQPHEHQFAKVEAVGPTVECKFAKIVLYAAHELLKNGGERSTDADWEIVCIIATDVENEPMNPLAMARNQLNKPGGSPCKYSSEEWAKAVWYWSQYVSVKGEE